MTEERNMSHSDPNSDPLVTRAYRDLADERVPEHLDRAILKDAATAARPRYSRLRTWTRPMAWAATVMLSVALVLEVTRLPAPELAPVADSAGKFEAQDFELDQPDDAPVEALGESIPPAAPAGRSMNGAVVAKKLAAPAAKADEFKLKDDDMLQRAEEMARRQSRDNNEPALPSVAADPASAEAPEIAVQGTAFSSFAMTSCDESATAKPETWLECIVELEEAGLANEARHQRELLQEAFPDFEPR